MTSDGKSQASPHQVRNWSLSVRFLLYKKQSRCRTGSVDTRIRKNGIIQLGFTRPIQIVLFRSLLVNLLGLPEHDHWRYPQLLKISSDRAQCESVHPQNNLSHRSSYLPYARREIIVNAHHQYYVPRFLRNHFQRKQKYISI